MENREYIINGIKHECNVLSSFINPAKRAKHKNSRVDFFILLDSRSISTIVIGMLTSKLKAKEEEKTTWETQAGKFTTSKKVNAFFLNEI